MHFHSLPPFETHPPTGQERGRKNRTMSVQFAASCEGEEEEEALDSGAVLAAAAAAEQWQESLEHLKHELGQCDEETKVI